MNNSYLKLFVDCLEKYQKLNDTEFGRLVRAALRYKATGAEPTDLGREALLWDGMRLDIDRDNESYAEAARIRSEAGKAGAAARWQGHKSDAKNAIAINRTFQNGKHQFLFAHAVGIFDAEIKSPVQELGDMQRFEFGKMHLNLLNYLLKRQGKAELLSPLF